MVGKMPARILVVDDDPGVTTSLALLLKQSGYVAETVATPQEALESLESGSFSLVLQDMNFSARTSGEEGLSLLTQIKGSFPGIPVVLMTAWGSVELAVRGVKSGAADFITKPWSHQQILHAVGTALGLAELERKPQSREMRNRGDLDSAYDFSGIVGEDPQFLKALEIIGRVAGTDAPVLITGESGTGKELFAEALWRNSERNRRPFIKVNLGGIPTSLFESEMFGHVRGAFTDAKQARMGRFEAADKGTLFLDEIGDLDRTCQVKLLRVLQDRTFEKVGSSQSMTANVRVISATNRDLPSMIEASQFREDLLYRLNLIAIRIPPLRHRRGDIALLAAHILGSVGAVYRRAGLCLHPSSVEWLSAQSWPGNVRQLKHLIERTVLLASRDELSADDFSQANLVQDDVSPVISAVDMEDRTLDEVEREMILRCMKKNGNNLTRVAEVLGLSRGALYRRLEKHGITP